VAKPTSKNSPNPIKRIKVGVLVKEHEGVLLDDTLNLSQEDFDCLLEHLDGMNIHVRVLQRKE
jgi:hypothetical protein